MKYTEIKGNLLDFPNNIQAIAQNCNCHCIQGAGIALQIKKRYPAAYEADLKTKSGDWFKMGKFSKAQVNKNQYIYNIYGQFDMGGERALDYEAIYNGLENVKNDLIKNKIKSIGFPKFMGCGLAGGNWNIVSTMIKEVFDETNINVYIVEYDDPKQ